MFTFEKEDHGYIATLKSTGRVAARITHSDVEMVGHGAAQKKVITPIERQKWQFHTTGVALSLAEWVALGNEAQAVA